MLQLSSPCSWKWQKTMTWARLRGWKRHWRLRLEILMFAFWLVLVSGSLLISNADRSSAFRAQVRGLTVLKSSARDWGRANEQLWLRVFSSRFSAWKTTRRWNEPRGSSTLEWVCRDLVRSIIYLTAERGRMPHYHRFDPLGGL
jgi:hypothetical protein